MKTRPSTLWSLIAILLAAAAPASAGLIGASVGGDVFEADIDLADPIDGKLEVSFGDSTGLSTTSLGASASLLDSVDLLEIQSRLPDTSVSVPSGYPVLVTIEPPTTGGLSFEGIATIEIYTDDLTYLLGSKLRLFAAPIGGDFTDITESMDGGSYRVRGSKGEFSQFVIATDLRSVDTVIVAKIDRLDDHLTTHQADIDSTVHSTLTGLLDDVETAHAADDLAGALGDLDDFIDTVENNRGTAIPDQWRAARDLENVAGKLRAAADTLRFSLVEKSAS